MKYTIISLLICALLAFSTAHAEEQSTSIKLGLFYGSNERWIAVAVQDGGVDTTAVQMRDSAEGAEWANMQFVEGWNHWVINAEAEYVLPLSFRLVSKTQEIVVDNIITDLDADIVDTGVQYSAPKDSQAAPRHGGHGGKKRPTTAPTTKPVTSAPTTKPVTTKPVTTAPVTTKPVTTAPVTTKPVTTKPVTTAPVTTKPVTTAPVTTKPVTTAPSTGTGKMKLLVPLYTYPGSTWDTVIASAGKVKTVAIINPNSGPGNGPDSTYKTYMAKMQSAGVEMIGYVHTSYGARSLTDVKADIAKYASEFPQVVGIFIDEADNSASQVSYYTQVNAYIMSMPGYKYNVLNPGAVPTAAYFSISTQIVTYESSASGFASSSNPSFANSGNADHFSVIAYGASQAQMTAGIAAAKSKGYYGWVYFTDNTSTNTYNSLPSYYAAMASAAASA